MISMLIGATFKVDQQQDGGKICFVPFTFLGVANYNISLRYEQGHPENSTRFNLI